MGEDTPSPGGTTNPTADVLFDALADAQRRVILEHLLETDGPRSVDELADAVVAEDDRSGAMGKEAVERSLHHVHLPKLADAGLLEHDAASGDVVGTPALAVAEPYLRLVATQADRDGRLGVAEERTE